MSQCTMICNIVARISPHLKSSEDLTETDLDAVLTEGFKATRSDRGRSMYADDF